jgi:hypothetical protein
MTELCKVPYLDYEEQLPKTGSHIIGSKSSESIFVYQAYRPSIAKFAMDNQFFGGDFKLSRMSWIKTNFLWMMHRSGWGSKKGQEHILAIEIKLSAFEEILENAVLSSFDSSKYEDIDKWQDALSKSSVRLQWDPDHDPFGGKLKRKAIQLGLKDEMLKKYSKEWILSIHDISDFVSEQRDHLLLGKLNDLVVIKEDLIIVSRDCNDFG